MRKLLVLAPLLLAWSAPVTLALRTLPRGPRASAVVEYADTPVALV